VEVDRPILVADGGTRNGETNDQGKDHIDIGKQDRSPSKSSRGMGSGLSSQTDITPKVRPLTLTSISTGKVAPGTGKPTTVWDSSYFKYNNNKIKKSVAHTGI
jgi:hypothetical protein